MMSDSLYMILYLVTEVLNYILAYIVRPFQVLCKR